MRTWWGSWAGIWAWAWTAGYNSSPPEPITGDGVPPSCEGDDAYPEGVVEPMTLGETIPPFRWAGAVHRGSGQRAALDLGQVPCALSPDIDWSPFDALLFVSIPAW